MPFYFRINKAKVCKEISIQGFRQIKTTSGKEKRQVTVGWELKLPSLPGGIFHRKTPRVNRSGKETCSLAGAANIHNSSQSKLLARTGKTFLYSLHPVIYKNASEETSPLCIELTAWQRYVIPKYGKIPYL